MLQALEDAPRFRDAQKLLARLANPKPEPKPDTPPASEPKPEPKEEAKGE